MSFLKSSISRKVFFFFQVLSYSFINLLFYMFIFLSSFKMEKNINFSLILIESNLFNIISTQLILFTQLILIIICTSCYRVRYLMIYILYVFAGISVAIGNFYYHVEIYYSVNFYQYIVLHNTTIVNYETFESK